MAMLTLGQCAIADFGNFLAYAARLVPAPVGTTYDAASQVLTLAFEEGVAVDAASYGAAVRAYDPATCYNLQLMYFPQAISKVAIDHTDVYRCVFAWKFETKAAKVLDSVLVGLAVTGSAAAGAACGYKLRVMDVTNDMRVLGEGSYVARPEGSETETEVHVKLDDAPSAPTLLEVHARKDPGVVSMSIAYLSLVYAVR